MIIVMALTTIISMIARKDEEPNKHFIMTMRGLMLPSVIKVVMRKVTLRNRGMMT